MRELVTKREFKIVGPEFNEAYADYELGALGHYWHIPHRVAMGMPLRHFFTQFRAGVADIVNGTELSPNEREILYNELIAVIDQKELTTKSILDL